MKVIISCSSSKNFLCVAVSLLQLRMKTLVKHTSVSPVFSSDLISHGCVSGHVYKWSDHSVTNFAEVSVGPDEIICSDRNAA